MTVLQLVLLTIVIINKNHAYVFKPGPLVETTRGVLWPSPQYQNDLDTKFFALLPSTFQFKVTGFTCSILNEALMRYKKIIKFQSRFIKETYYKVRDCKTVESNNFAGILSDLAVNLTEPCGDDDLPYFEMPESYSLEVSVREQTLFSNSIWGILNGLESFSQLIYLTEDLACHQVNTILVHDSPKLTHRGLLLDTSRHYIQKDEILRMLDAMSFNKLNVFHWHITDDYSFPYESYTFPELSEKGSFNPAVFTYDQAFVKTVQEYARMRGIRVIPEFDTPGHTLSWGLGVPDLLTACHNVPSLEWGPMDPTKNSTYEFVFKLFEEINSVFKDQFVHLGGDEVDFSCWKSNALVKNFMSENKMTDDFVALQSHYVQKLVDYVTNLGLSSIVWEEVFTNGVDLPKNVIVNVWKSDDPKGTLLNVTTAGYKAIMSSYWYLDIVNSNLDWPAYYKADPLDFTCNPDLKKLVIGAEASVWSELIDENNLESRVFPRASVAAERFWARRNEDIMAVAARLEEQTCRMNRRGIRAQPATGPSVSENNHTNKKYYPKINEKIWLQNCKQEIRTPLEGSVIGTVPKWLQGILIRNGPGTFQAGAEEYNHIFDGSSLLQSFAIKNGKIAYQCRFLQSQVYQQNWKTNRVVMTEFGTGASSNWSVFYKVAAIFRPGLIGLTDNNNVSIYPNCDQVFAYGETTITHRIDPVSLKTLQRVDLRSHFSVLHSSGHPQVTESGIFNLAISVYLTGVHFTVLKLNKEHTGKVVATFPARWPLHPSYFHTFGVTENYFIVIEQPFCISVFGLLMTQIKNQAYADCFRWYKDEKTQFSIIDRKSGNLAYKFFSNPFFFLHIINQYETNDYIVIDVCIYNDPSLINCLYLNAIKTMQQNAQFAKPFRSKPARFVLPLRPKKTNLETNLIQVYNCKAEAFYMHKSNDIFVVPEILADVTCETPTINYELYSGKKYRYFYAVGTNIDSKQSGSIIKVDTFGKAHLEWYEAGCFASEAVFVARPGGKAEDDGVLLASILWGSEHRVGLVILNAESMAEIGRCVFRTPGPVPKCFHGWFLK